MNCPICNAVKEWEPCDRCDGCGGWGDVGLPEAGCEQDWISCPDCDGRGGWFICPNQDAHDLCRALDEIDASPKAHDYAPEPIPEPGRKMEFDEAKSWALKRYDGALRALADDD